MRLSNSKETSNWLAAGIEPVLNQSTVGSDISSATHGSSMISVAGKNRGPTKQCAKELERGRRANSSASAEARRFLGKRYIECLHPGVKGMAARTRPPAIT